MDDFRCHNHVPVDLMKMTRQSAWLMITGNITCDKEQAGNGEYCEREKYKIDERCETRV